LLPTQEARKDVKKGHQIFPWCLKTSMTRQIGTRSGAEIAGVGMSVSELFNAATENLCRHPAPSVLIRSKKLSYAQTADSF